VAELCRRVGVAQEHCVLEFEEQGASRKLSPEAWSRGVSHAIEKGYQFHYWEIANEPSSSLWGHGEAFPTPEAFISHFKAVSRAIRQADPKARVGIDINPEQVRWGNYLLKQLAGDYDLVAPHYYCGADVHKLPFEQIVLTENYRMLDRALTIKALLRAYNSNRPVYQYDTEWGMICGTPEGKDADYEDRNANIIGTLHRAVRLIYYAREDVLRGASGWQMLSRLNAQGFGILSQESPEKRFMLYWLYYYFNRHLGEWVLGIDGRAPYFQLTDAKAAFKGPLTPVLASLSRDGRELYLVIANGSWAKSVACRIGIENFTAHSAKGTLLSNDKLDGKPLLEKKSDAVSDFPVNAIGKGTEFTLPPHAVVFITLTTQ
jgi:alpha-L-arabinofuranosidase